MYINKWLAQQTKQSVAVPQVFDTIRICSTQCACWQVVRRRAVPREVGPPPGGPTLVHTQIPVVFFTQSGVPGEVTDVLASSCGPVAVCTQAMEHIGQLSCSPLCCGHLFALQHYIGRFLLHPIMHIHLRFSMTQACFCMQVCTRFIWLPLIWAHHS